MIGLDTNLLVRLVMRDDPVQTRRVDRLLASGISAGQPGYINRIVIAETAWVLESAYGCSRAQVASAIQLLTRWRDIVVEDGDLVDHAAEQAIDQDADLVDLLIATSNDRRGCSTTLTFDRRAAQRSGMRLL